MVCKANATTKVKIRVTNTSRVMFKIKYRIQFGSHIRVFSSGSVLGFGIGSGSMSRPMWKSRSRSRTSKVKVYFNICSDPGRGFGSRVSYRVKIRAKIKVDFMGTIDHRGSSQRRGYFDIFAN